MHAQTLSKITYVRHKHVLSISSQTTIGPPHTSTNCVRSASFNFPEQTIPTPSWARAAPPSRRGCQGNAQDPSSNYAISRAFVTTPGELFSYILFHGGAVCQLHDYKSHNRVYVFIKTRRY